MNISTNRHFQRAFRISPEELASEPIKLDIGCGEETTRADKKKKEGRWIGIDIVDGGQEIVWNFEQGLPFADNSVSEVFCSHVLEHLDDPTVLLNEINRVLKPDATAHIIVPHKDHPRANAFSHIRYCTEETFRMLDVSNVIEDWDHVYGIMPWQIDSIVTNDRMDIHVKMRPFKQKDQNIESFMK